MKNLVTDKPAPITVSKASMKNLVTDKPAPITVALAQKDSDTAF